MSRMNVKAQEIKQTIFQLVEQLSDQVDHAAQKGIPLHELERDIFTHVLKIGYYYIERLFLQTGTGDVGEQLALTDGKMLKRLDKTRQRPYLSPFGTHQVPYVAYGTREGQKIEHIPLYQHLQLPTEKYSYFLQDLGQKMAVEIPYAKVKDFLENLLPISLPVSGLERTNQVLAQSVQDYWEQQPKAVEATSEQLIVMQSDGKGVVIRPEKRAKNQATKKTSSFETMISPSTSKTHDGRKKVAIVSSVYTLDRHPRKVEDVLESLFEKTDKKPEAKVQKTAKKCPPQPKDKRIRVSMERDEKGTLAPARTRLFSWQQDELAQRDPEHKATAIYLMDGEKKLWENAAEQTPEGVKPVEILDLLHATSYVWMASKALHPYRDKDLLIDRFVKDKVNQLLKGEVESLVTDFRALGQDKKLSSKRLEKLETACNYLSNQAHRMRYHEYLAHGYPIASGVIEGACRYVVKDRMERTGMRWVMSGAEAMLGLRCIDLNGNWNDFVAFHIQQTQQQRYVDAANDDYFGYQQCA